MKRDEFIKKSLRVGLASGCMMVAGGANAFSQEDTQLKKCRVTVLKKTINKEIADSFRISEVKSCDRFEVGQEFVVEDPFSCPEGFCHWAWADIRYDILACVLGGKRSWVNPPDVGISCCTDGYRPVIFKVEAVN